MAMKIKCKICFKSFTPQHGASKTCSPECAAENKRRNEEEARRRRLKRGKYDWLEGMNEYLRQNNGIYNPKSKG